VLPDAGTFWYRPHINETVQLEKGLYGALVVRGHDEPHLDGERVLVLDDLKLDRKGNIARFGGFKPELRDLPMMERICPGHSAVDRRSF